MKFYSYEYLLNKIDQSNTITYVTGGFLLLIIIVSLFKYYKNRQDSKYRELALIMILGIFLLIGIQVSDYRVISNGKKGDYLLEKIELVEPIVEKVEVKR